MAESIGDLHIVLRADTGSIVPDAAKGLKESEPRIQAQATSLGSTIAESISDGMKAEAASIHAKTVAMGNLIADGIKAGIAGIGKLISGTINLGIEGLDRIDALDEAAGKVGLTYNAFQDLKFAAESAGGSVEALSSSLAKMQSGIASGKSEDALELLKLDLKEIKAMEPDKQFAEIIDKLSKLKSTAEKIDITKQIFGKGGIELMNVINNGKDGLEEVRQIVESFGGHLRDADIAMVGMANDNLDKLKNGWGFIKDQIAVGIAPVLVMMTKEIVKQSEKVGGIGPQVKQWVDYGNEFVAKMATVVQFVDAIGNLFWRAGETIGSVISVMTAGFKVAFEAVKVSINEVEKLFKQLAISATDAIGDAFNSLKNSALKTLNDLSTEATVTAAEIAKALNPSAAGTYQTGIDIMRSGQKNYKPTDVIPDIPTGNEPGSISAELFPKDANVVDYTALNAAVDEASKVAIAANDEILKSGAVLEQKLTDIYEGNFWGDSYRKFVADAKAANLNLADNAKDTANDLIDIDREAALGKKENLDWFEKESLEHFKRLGKQLYDWQQANERTMEQFRSLNRDVVGDLVTSWVTGTGKISDIISQWTNNMIRQFTQLALFGNKGPNGTGGTITGLIGSLFGGLGSTASTTAGTTAAASTGGGWASTLGSIFGGFFEKGGRPPMGKISVIGEDGPEFWMPDSAGRIIPNDQLASFVGGGGSGVSVDQPMVFNFHNYYQTGVTQADLAGAMDSMQDAAMAAVYEGVRRGGGYRKGVQG